MILLMERPGPVPRGCGKLAAAKSRPRPPLTITRATKVLRFRSEWEREREEILWDLLCLEEDCLIALEGSEEESLQWLEEQGRRKIEKEAAGFRLDDWDPVASPGDLGLSSSSAFLVQPPQETAPPQVVSDSDEGLLESAKKVLEALSDDGE